MTDMLSQQNQSMTKTKSSSSTMDNANTSVVGNSSKEKMGASATTNNSSTNTGGSASGTPGNSATGKNNESGSQNVYQSAAEHLPKLQSILPVVTQCTYTECYWYVRFLNLIDLMPLLSYLPVGMADLNSVDCVPRFNSSSFKK